MKAKASETFLFPVRVYKSPFHFHQEVIEQNLDHLQKCFDEAFSKNSNMVHALEAGPANSSCSLIDAETFLSSETYKEWHLLREPEYKTLRDGILYHAKEYIQGLPNYWKAQFPLLKAIWANIHKKNGITLTHSHESDQVHIAGVYYLKKPENSGHLIVSNPLSTLNGYLMKDFIGWPDLVPNTKIKSNEGGVVLFPSWLEHSTEPNKSDKDRICISFNIQILPVPLNVEDFKE